MTVLDHERVLVLASNRPTAQRLRQRVEALLGTPYEELWIGTWGEICERLLREHSTAAGLDPFFDVLGPAERLAILLERLDDLPLRNHEIRGNPAGLLARLLRAGRRAEGRIGATRAGAGRVLRRPRSHPRRIGQPRRGRRLPPPRQAPARAGRGADRDRVPLRLPDGRRARGHDAPPSARSWRASPPRTENHLYAEEGREPSEWFHSLHPAGEVVSLRERFRQPATRFWRCRNERAQAQAVAREVEHLLGAGAPPGEHLRAGR